MMGCGLKKVGNLLAELDSRKGIGLITRIRQGLGRPDKIYVRNRICIKGISRHVKMTFLEMPK